MVTHSESIFAESMVPNMQVDLKNPEILIHSLSYLIQNRAAALRNKLNARPSWHLKVAIYKFSKHIFRMFIQSRHSNFVIATLGIYI